MFLNQRLSALLILLALVSFSTASDADQLESDKHFRFSGFATLALTKSGDENLGFHRDLDREGLFDGDWSLASDSLLGVQLDLTVNDQLGGAIQLVGKDRADDSLENSVEWAFLRYRINPEWTIRAGRIGFDLFMLSEYRNVGFAYLWTRPPVEFYAPLTFNGFDGLDVAWSTQAWGGSLRAKISAGNSQSTFKILGNLVDIEVEEIIGATISWETEHWQLKLSTSDGKTGKKGAYYLGSEPLVEALELVGSIWPESASILDNLFISDPHVRYYALGIAYSNNPWQIQSEISRTDPEFGLYPATLHGYISAGYQVSAFTPYLMLAKATLMEDPLEAPPAPEFPTAPVITEQLALLQQSVQTLYDAISTDQSTLTLGMRWDFRYDMALKVQLDHTWIEQRGFGLWDFRGHPSDDVEINTFSINLNCIF